MIMCIEKSCGWQAYDGQVRQDLNHDLLKPAAWRIENYLDGDDDADHGNVGTLMRGGLKFVKLPKDDMTRNEQVDDYSVGPS